jgi:PAS domain S-box-containing protein
LTRALENRFDYVLQGLNKAHSFQGGQPSSADRDKFTKAAQNLMKQRPSIFAVAWAPRVPAANREYFETTSRFTIREFHDGTLTLAGTRPEYYPVLYREPDWPGGLGFDVATELAYADALHRATHYGEAAASAPTSYPQDAEKKHIRFFLPVYQDNVIPVGPEERAKAVVGHVVAIVYLDRIVEHAWERFLSAGIDFWLFDETSAGTLNVAYFRPGSKGKPVNVSAETDRDSVKARGRKTRIQAAGRSWTLQFVPTAEYLAAHRSTQAWIVLAGGMLCSGLLASVLLVVTGRAELVTKIVDERTSLLAQANAAMKQEIAERKRVEEALRTREESLRQSEERFRLLVEGTIDYAIFMLDPSGAVISWNAGAERINQYRADEIIGKNFASLFTKEDVKQGKPARMLKTAEKMGRSEDEGWRLRKDGSKFWVHSVITPLRDAEGNLRGYWKIIRDLTERKRTEEKFRDLLESAPEAVVITQEDGTIALVNRQTERFFGFSRAELLGRPISMLMPSRHHRQYDHFRASCLVNHAAQPLGTSLVLSGRRKDGGEFPVEISLSPLATEEGTLVSTSIRDITDRKRSEAALEETRRFVQRVTEMTPSILYVYDVKEQCNIFVNHRLESFLGYPWEKDTKPTMPTLMDDIHPDDLARAEWANEQCQNAEDGAVIETEYRIRHANGEWRWLNSRNTIFVRDTEGNPQQILGAAQDITDRKRLEQEVLDIAASEQRRIGQELHDGTGQELTGLCLLAENLVDSLRGTNDTEAQKARRIALGLRQALSQVRSLSRGLIPVEVDAEGLMAALAELTNRISDLHAVQCVFECLEPVPVEDNQTATHLYRIAQEAITNALKHGQAANLRVSLEAHGHYITLKIADDGVGIPSADEITEGMGLRIMRYRAGQIGAHLTVRAEPTGGTVVTCTLYRGTSHE